MAAADHMACASLSFVFRDNAADRGECGRSVLTRDLRWGQRSLSAVQLFFTSLVTVNGFAAWTTFSLTFC